MAVRKILDVDLSQVERFTDLFQKYQEQLARTQPAWAAVSGEAKSSAASFERLTAALLAQTELSRRMGAEQRDAAHAAGQQAGAWERIAHATKGASGHIVEATRSLLRWSAVVTGVSAIFSMGGLYGIDRLAVTAGSGLKSSRGLGMSYGEQKAFGTEFSPVLGSPQQYLSGVFDALHNAQKSWILSNSGLTPAQMHGDTAQVGVAFLDKLKTFVDRTPDNIMAQALHSHGYDQIINLQDAERLKHTHRSELNYERQGYSRAVSLMDLTRGQQTAWQHLQVQLNAAAQEIETTLIKGLAPLAPDLLQLSKAFVDLLHSAFGTGTFKNWIDDAAKGIKWFADDIKKPAFKKDMLSLIANIGAFADKVIWALKELDIIPSGKKQHLGLVPRSPAEIQHDKESAARHLKRGDVPIFPDPNRGGKPLFWLPHITLPSLPAAPNIPGVPPGMFMPTAFRTGAPVIPYLLMAAQMTAESGGNQYALSPTGNMGLFQFGAATWKEYAPAGSSPWDPKAQAVAYRRYMGHLLRQYGGNTEEALAAYNWGPGNLDRDLTAHGGAWQRFLPPETQTYIARVLKLMAGTARRMQITPPPSVQVHNNTGGSAILSMAQLTRS